MKPKNDWDPVEDEVALGSSRALNCIYNDINKNIFKIINSITSVKDVWETLKVAHEGTFKVRVSRFQLVTIKFENLKKLKEETNIEFNVCLHILSITLLLSMKICQKRRL